MTARTEEQLTPAPDAATGVTGAATGSVHQSDKRGGRNPLGRLQGRQPRTMTYIILLGLLVLVAAPLLSVLVTAFTGYREEPSALGMLAHADMLTVMGNTVLLSVLVVLFATLMAAPLAVAMAWTPMARHTWIDVVVMVPFMTPPFAAAMAWMDVTRFGGIAAQLGGKAVGQLAHNVIYSVWGMALIMACELFPFLYLLLRNACATVPASAIESARVVGATWGEIVGRILVPILIGPYSLGALIVFIRAAGEFGTPVTLGNAIGFPVLVSSIHQNITVDPISFSRAAASSSVLFGLGVTVWAIQQYVSRKDISGGGRVARPVRLTPSLMARCAMWLHMIAVFLLSVIIPYISIVLGAMTILRSQPPTLTNLTFDYFAIALGKSSAQEALLNSALLGFLGATVAIIVATAVALTAHRARRNLPARVNDFLAVAPDTVPGIVMAVGFILLWNAPWLPLTPYGTRWILVLGYTVMFLPMAVQNVKASLAGVSPTLVEAAHVAGATRLVTLVRIILPLLMPGIIAGWLLAFLVGIRELVMSSLIRPADLNLLSPWIMNQFDQGNRPEAMAMTLIGVVSSTVVLIVVTTVQRRHAAGTSRKAAA